MKFGMREEFTCPIPRPRYGDGPRIWHNPNDGTLTCSYDVPKRRVMAMDQAPGNDDATALYALLRDNLDPDVLSQVEDLIVRVLNGGGPVNNDLSSLTNAPSLTRDSEAVPPGMGAGTKPAFGFRSMAGDSRQLRERVAWEKRFAAQFPGVRLPRVLG